jgi:alanine dehydrogenase
VLVLSRSDVRALLTVGDCIEAVEDAFRLHANGASLGPGVLGVPAPGGGFHIKAAGLIGPQASFFAAKTNANYPENPRQWGLPTIQGVVVLADAVNGGPLAVMESGSLTALRTGAATAVAAKHLARRGAGTVTIVGCGAQGLIQLEALAEVLPVARVRLVDVDVARAHALATHAEALGMRVDVASAVGPAARDCDVLVTCTPSRHAFVRRDDVAPGTFIAAVGADSQGKQELAVDLVAGATLVVDVLDQCAEIGELQHALGAGIMTRAQVHAELAEVVNGTRPGRTRADEVTIFDSTGTALEDVAAAMAVYRRARASGRGIDVKLDD